MVGSGILCELKKGTGHHTQFRLPYLDFHWQLFDTLSVSIILIVRCPHSMRSLTAQDPRLYGISQGISRPLLRRAGI